MNLHLYMISFDGREDHWMDGGFVEVETIFVAAENEQAARAIAVEDDLTGYLWDESGIDEVIDLGCTDKPSGFCTDDWNILTPAHYEVIHDSMASDDESEAS